MTPRQMYAYLMLAYRRRCGLNAELLMVLHVATQGTQKGYDKFMKKLRDESS